MKSARSLATGSPRRDTLVLAALLVGQLLLVAHQIRGTPQGGHLNYWTAVAVQPFQRMFDQGARVVAAAWSTYVWQAGAARENRRLGQETASLRVENLFLRTELGRAVGQARVDEFRAGLSSTTLSARVIGRGPSDFAKEVVIDRGAKDGVQPSMAVIAPEGIVGRVTASYRSSSMVILLNDAESGAGVELAGSGAQGVLVGTNGPQCEIEYILRAVRVSPGQRVYTSGLDGVFPRGMPVGIITEVTASSETHRITVQPAVDLERLADVAVVLKGAHERIPDDVRMALTDLPALRADRPEMVAGRIKEALRGQVSKPGRDDGPISPASPDLRAAVAGQMESEQRGIDSDGD